MKRNAKCMHKARERENNGRMNGNKNGKNEDEFEKSAHVKEGEREKNLGTCI